MRNLVKSNIKREGDLYKITLPSIEGFCEGVFYSHEGVTMDYLSSGFSEKLSFMKVDGNMHHIFLMSSICGYIFLRIIDTLNFYHDSLIIIRSGDFFSFIIKDKSYFVLLYENPSGEIGYYTNFEDGPIFKANYDNYEFNIFNTLTGMSVHNCSYYPPETLDDTNNIEPINNENLQHLIIMDDALFPEKKELQKVKKILQSQKKDSSISLKREKFTDSSLVLSYSQNLDGTLSEGEKLFGFLGTHQCILENPGNMREYISLKELTDLNINIPESFMPSGKIDSLDPGWHKLRKTLMELEYMTSIIRVHIGALEGSIDSIDALNSPYLNLQKDHSTMTLIDLEKIEKTYTIYLTTLISLLKNSLP